MPEKKFPQQQRMKSANMAAILRAVAVGKDSKRGIQDATGLSWGSVSESVNRLLDNGVLEAVPSTPTAQKGPGRKNAAFRFSGKRNLVLGMEPAPRAVRYSLTDLGGNEIVRSEYALRSAPTNRSLPDTLAKTFEDVRVRTGVPIRAVRRIALALTGAVDVRRNVWLRTPRLPGIRNLGLDALASALPRNTVLAAEHDINARARAVMSASERGNAGYAFIHCAHGIGMAVHDGTEFFSGYRNLEGEIGHIPVPNPAFPLRCTCGRDNCLEQYLSTNGITSLARHVISKTAVRGFKDIGRLPSGDKKELYGHLMPLLRYMCTIAVNLFDPHTLVLGGEALRYWEEGITGTFFNELKSVTWQNGPPDFMFYTDSDGECAYGAALGCADALIDDMAGTLA